jgi:predicted DNA-binding transcriptional regulator YafY
MTTRTKDRLTRIEDRLAAVEAALEAEQQLRRWLGEDVDGLIAERVRAERRPRGTALGTNPPTSDPADMEELIHAAIDAERAIAFVYENGETSARVISPYELRVAGNGHLMVSGFDHGRDAMRHFRVGRIRAVSFAAAPYVEPVDAYDGVQG